MLPTSKHFKNMFFESETNIVHCERGCLKGALILLELVDHGKRIQAGKGTFLQHPQRANIHRPAGPQRKCSVPEAIAKGPRAVNVFTYSLEGGRNKSKCHLLPLALRGV